MDNKNFLPVKSDILFRLFFADERNETFLVDFLKSVLKLPDDDYNEIEIANPHLLREFEDDKMSIIDVKLHTKSRKIIHIEIQLKVSFELKNRIVLYDSKLITEQIKIGKEYDVIKKVISIIITDDELIEGSPKYHHRFTFYDPKANVEFTDIIEIHALELKKLPDGYDGTQLYDWAKFIAAESDDELTAVAKRNPEVNKAVVNYRELTADEYTRDLYERREKARRDQVSREKDAKLESIKERNIEIAKNLLTMNLPLDQISKATGLSVDEIEEL